MFRMSKMGLLPLCCAIALSGCAFNRATQDGPQIPASAFDCAEWPNPPSSPKNTQKYVAAWLETQVYPAWQDCKGKLKTVQRIVETK